MQNPVNRAPYGYHGEYSPKVTMVNTAGFISSVVFLFKIGHDGDRLFLARRRPALPSGTFGTFRTYMRALYIQAPHMYRFRMVFYRFYMIVI